MRCRCQLPAMAAVPDVARLSRTQGSLPAPCNDSGARCRTASRTHSRRPPARAGRRSHGSASQTPRDAACPACAPHHSLREHSAPPALRLHSCRSGIRTRLPGAARRVLSPARVGSNCARPRLRGGGVPARARCPPASRARPAARRAACAASLRRVASAATAALAMLRPAQLGRRRRAWPDRTAVGRRLACAPAGWWLAARRS